MSGEVTLSQLSASDPALKKAIEVIGEPVIRRRPGGLKGLTRIIIQQQLSVASAQSILKRCDAALNLGEAEPILSATEDQMRACGLSRPKIKYIKEIAHAVTEKRLNFLGLKKLTDEEALAALIQIKGIGPWTAAIYLLFCDGRLSVWPPNDVALLAAYTHAAGLAERPPMKEFDEMAANKFSPQPGLAAHILWTYYGHIKNRTPV